jgi:DNA modification methylase
MVQSEATTNARKQTLNDLDGRTWTRYSISVWDIVKTPEENKLNHPAMYPVELCRRLIEIYTRKGDTVLDPFMGSGSTVVAAKNLGRKGIGLDIIPEYVDLARSRLSQQKLFDDHAPEPEVHCWDATRLLEVVSPKSVDLVITSPPYWIIHQRKRTADYKESRPYSQLDSDLGNIEDYGQFLSSLKSAFSKIHEALKPGKRCIVIVMDIRVGSNFIPFHMDVVNKLRELGFILEDIIIWDRKREYSNLRPLGFPYVFVVNKIHEYILIFRRNRETDTSMNDEEIDRLS